MVAATAALLLLGGCAALPAGKRDPRDPFERVNRSIYRFNVAADHAVLRPAARAWQASVPLPVRRSLKNFVTNLGYPTTIINDLLQGKFGDGDADFARLLINSIGGLGFFDPAARLGLERHDEDFGQTLGKWGVPAGPFVMLPFLGPSSTRDAPSLVVDEYTNGRHYLTDPYVNWGLWLTDKLNLRVSLLPTDRVVETAYDPYTFTRNAWLQRREYQVRDGAVDETPADTDRDAGLDPGNDPGSDSPGH
jgi:phospholipid-binding lipoprotein MlaA